MNWMMEAMTGHRSRGVSLQAKYCIEKKLNLFEFTAAFNPNSMMSAIAQGKEVEVFREGGDDVVVALIDYVVKEMGDAVNTGVMNYSRYSHIFGRTLNSLAGGETDVRKAIMDAVIATKEPVSELYHEY